MSAPAAPAGRPVISSGIEIEERQAWSVSGWLGVVGVVIAGFLAWLVSGTDVPLVPLILVIIAVLLLSALVVVPPGQTRVLLFFGRYVGTVRSPGFGLVTPLTTRRAVSTRVRNFETSRLKVNDADGNPVEIAAVVVWQVADTARAVFAVDDYADFVRVQSESALRHVATTHPYDNPREDGMSLRGSTDVVARELADEVADRVAVAGVRIIEVRVTHLAYASEIAQAMLRRQQAAAVVSARSRIVEGAVGMVEMALERLSERDIVELDEERKAAMVSNLMVVLCGDQPPSPVVNAGSLYA